MMKAPEHLGRNMMMSKLGGTQNVDNNSDFSTYTPEPDESEITESRRITIDDESQPTPYSNKLNSEKILESLEDLKVLELKEVFEKSKELLKKYKKELGNIR